MRRKPESGSSEFRKSESGKSRAEGLKSMAPRSKKAQYAVLLAALLLPTAAACGIQPTGITELGPAPAAAAVSPLQTLDTSPGSTQYLVFFYNQNDQLAPAYRSAKGEVTEQTVLQTLIGGPSQQEQAAGVTSAVPTGLIARPKADNELGNYNLSAPLGLRAKAQFICTMQYFDQLDSIGIQVVDAKPIWNSCSDTTSQYIPMRGDQSSVPSPSPSSS